MTFRIYDDATVGSLLWSESQEVEVDSAGVFSVILGTTTALDIAFDGPIWLDVEVEGEILSPRREMVSVPFAFMTGEAEHALASDHALNADSLGGIGSDSYSLEGHAHAEYLARDEVSSVTGDMITDGEITDGDVAPDAGIDPGKIAGGAWTSENDGAGSGLDADMVDGLHADAFADTGHSHDAFADTGHAHDDRCYLQEELNTTGTINDGGNPVAWTRLKDVPSGFADGTLSWAFFGVSQESNTVPFEMRFRRLLASTLPDGARQEVVNVQGVFEVSQGMDTIYFLAYEEGGAWSVDNVYLTVVFIPSSCAFFIPSDEDASSADTPVPSQDGAQVAEGSVPSAGGPAGERQVEGGPEARAESKVDRLEHQVAVIMAEMEALKQRMAQ